MGFYLALYYVLDVVTHMVPILKMPQGGSVGLSVIALLLASYHLGWKKGVTVGLLSVLVQYLTGPLYFESFLGLFLDYLFAFGIYGIACLIPNQGNLFWGVLLTNFLRFLAHTIGGVICWGSTWAASIAYNGPYMLATTIVAMIAVPVIYSRIKVLNK